MMDLDNTFKILDKEGNEITFEVLFTFESDETGKNYMVYTDNSKDEQGNIRVYSSVFEPDSNPLRLLPVETEREWRIIETILESIQEENKKNNEENNQSTSEKENSEKKNNTSEKKISAEQTDTEQKSDKTEQLPDVKTEKADKTEQIYQQEADERKAQKRVREAVQKENSEAAGKAHESYVIQPGDTLFQISMDRYGSIDAISQICKLNGMSADEIIYPGQVIVLP